MGNSRSQDRARSDMESRYRTDDDMTELRTAGQCTAVIGSMTQAMKAQTALAEAAIRANITKISSTQTHNGCAYGVDFPCTQSGNVRIVLNKAGVRVRQYLQG